MEIWYFAIFMNIQLQTPKEKKLREDKIIENKYLLYLTYFVYVIYFTYKPLYYLTGILNVQ